MTMPIPEDFPVSRAHKELLAAFAEFFESQNAELATYQGQDDPQKPLPEWVLNTSFILWSPYLHWLEGVEESGPTLENMGKMMGGLKFATDNILNLAPLLALHKRLGTEKTAKQQLRPLRLFCLKLRCDVRKILNKVQKYPAHETQGFYEGYRVALKNNHVDPNGAPVIKNDATLIYLFLILFSELVEQQNSFTDLHTLLGKAFPGDVLGDLERLKGISKRIGSLGQEGKT